MGTARHGSGSAAPSAAAHRLRLLVALIALANAAVSVSKCWAMLEQVQQRMPPMFLHYTGFAGLNNQLGSHLRMLAIASVFNATRGPGDGPVTLVTSLAYSRHNFSKLWFDEYPIEHILDFEAYANHWRPTGMYIQKSADTAACLQLPLVNHDPSILVFGKETARHPGMTDESISLKDTIGTASAILAAARKAVRDHTGLWARLVGSPWPVECVAIELGWPAFLAHDWNWGAYWQGPALAKSLAFPKHIEAAAAAVIAALAPLSSGGEFWGVHLRLEEDFKQIDWYRGRRKNYDPVVCYIQAMQAANFTPQTTVYVASGIFLTMNATEIAALTRRFVEAGVVGGALHHKESLVPPATFEGLSTEQLGLVDMLVLRQAALVVGDRRSTFAENLRVMREADGRQAFFPVPIVPVPQ